MSAHAHIGLPADTAHAILVSVHNVRATQLVSFVTATIVIYDYIVCLEREIELIWKKRWSVIKLAFLWHRYFGLACVLFQLYAFNSPLVDDEVSPCKFWFYWETWGYCGVLFTAEAVLLLWIYVVYNKNKWILALMGICYAAEVATVAAILVCSFEHFHASAFHAEPNINYCFLTQVGAPFPLLWVPILAYDSLLLLLFMYRGCAGMHATRRWRWAYSYDGLLDMIYKHSLLNFLAIFASYLACAIIWLTSSIGSYQAPVAFALSLSITNCTRLLLNIRRAYYSGVGAPVLLNIRDLAPTGTSTPVGLGIASLGLGLGLEHEHEHDRDDDHGGLAPPLPRHVPLAPLRASSAISAFTALSESTTLRERERERVTGSPESTLRVPSASPRGDGWLRSASASSSVSAYARAPSPPPHARAHSLSASTSTITSTVTSTINSTSTITSTSAETLRAGAARPRHAHEYERESVGAGGVQVEPRTVSVSGEAVDPDWWQVELREMRAAPGIAFGEAL